MTVPRRRPIAAALAVAVLASLGLAGCGAIADATTSTPPTRASSGEPTAPATGPDRDESDEPVITSTAGSDATGRAWTTCVDQLISVYNIKMLPSTYSEPAVQLSGDTAAVTVDFGDQPSTVRTRCFVSGLSGTPTVASFQGPHDDELQTELADWWAMPADPVRYSFRCGTTPTGPETGAETTFETLAEVWASRTAFTHCFAVKHGTTWSADQEKAARTAAAVMPKGLDQLDSLYAQCALRDNEHAARASLADDEKAAVRGFLTLCPDHPEAERLRALSAR
ncbi:hypothetical protein ACPEEZ_04225 [Frigoribacterium sp. 2-23]|uniref:hypothetical protein n=1 Tax=Frigoribacterium sp. 2-23 TaxID=3415006 RepID=UPI003C6FFD79